MKDVRCVYNAQIGGITREMRFHYCLFCFACIFAFLCNYLFNLEELVYHTLLNEQRKLHNILLHFLFCFVKIKTKILEPKIALKLALQCKFLSMYSLSNYIRYTYILIQLIELYKIYIFLTIYNTYLSRLCLAIILSSLNAFGKSFVQAQIVKNMLQNCYIYMYIYISYIGI